MRAPSLERLGRVPLAVLRSPGFLIFAGGMARSAFGFVIGLVIARQLGVEDYGLFYTYTVIFILSLTMTGDALDGGVVRFFTYRLHHDPTRAHAVLGSALLLRAAAVAPLLAVGGAVAALLPPDAVAQGYADLVMAGLLSGVFGAFVSFANAICLSRERFVERATLLPALNAVRCVAVSGVLLAGVDSLIPVVWVDTTVVFAFALLTFWLVRQDLVALGFCRETLRQLFDYAKWSVLGMTTYLLYIGLNAPLLIFFAGEAAAGSYGAAVSFVMVVEHAAGALVTVQWQKASKVNSAGELRVFLRKTAGFALICALALAPLGVVGGPLLELAFGSGFSAGAAIFPIVFVGTIVHLISMPLTTVFIAVDAPHRITYATLAGFVAWGLAAAVLIPLYAEVGAALSVVIARVVQALALAAMIRRLLGAMDAGRLFVDDRAEAGVGVAR